MSPIHFSGFEIWTQCYFALLHGGTSAERVFYWAENAAKFLNRKRQQFQSGPESKQC